MNEDDLKYYQSELKRILPLASAYPLRFKVWSDTGETRTLNLNVESLQALTEVFKAIEDLKGQNNERL